MEKLVSTEDIDQFCKLIIGKKLVWELASVFDRKDLSCGVIPILVGFLLVSEIGRILTECINSRSRFLLEFESQISKYTLVQCVEQCQFTYRDSNSSKNLELKLKKISKRDPINLP